MSSPEEASGGFCADGIQGACPRTRKQVESDPHVRKQTGDFVRPKRSCRRGLVLARGSEQVGLRPPGGESQGACPRTRKQAGTDPRPRKQKGGFVHPERSHRRGLVLTRGSKQGTHRLVLDRGTSGPDPRPRKQGNSIRTELRKRLSSNEEASGV